MLRDDVLREAGRLINGDRAEAYGSARDNFSVIADLWGAYLGCELGSHQVAVMMILVKVARLVPTPTHADSWVDMAGYAALGGEIAPEDGDDGVRAR
jgi:hypothetical protein